jgi:hypothetical protein
VVFHGDTNEIRVVNEGVNIGMREESAKRLEDSFASSSCHNPVVSDGHPKMIKSHFRILLLIS